MNDCQTPLALLSLGGRMKMIKALKKKLNSWSRKKRKRKSLDLEASFYHHYHPIPPPCSYYHCCSSTQPSAPPLPSWLEAEQTQGQELISPLEVQPLVESSYPNQPQEIVPETSPICPTSPGNINSSTAQSYQQQHTVPNPVYGTPLLVMVDTRKQARSAGFLGHVVELLSCFCPCLRIREEPGQAEALLK